MTTTPTTQEEPFWLTLLRWGFKAAWWATRWLCLPRPAHRSAAPGNLPQRHCRRRLHGYRDRPGHDRRGRIPAILQVGLARSGASRRPGSANASSKSSRSTAMTWSPSRCRSRFSLETQRVSTGSRSPPTRGTQTPRWRSMLDVIASDMGASISPCAHRNTSGRGCLRPALRDPLAEPLTDKAPVLVNPPQSAHGPMTVGVDQIGSPVKLQLYSKQQGGTRIFVAGRSGSR